MQQEIDNPIFISYKRLDKDKVFELKDEIEKATKVKCWIDLYGIESDSQFANVIINAINKAEIVLFMYSQNHTVITDYETDWTIRELTFAQEKKKRIVFINLDNTPLTDWFKLMFGTKQQIDGNSSRAMEKLAKDLKLWLAKGHDDNDSQHRQKFVFSLIGNKYELAIKEVVLYFIGFVIVTLSSTILIYYFATQNHSLFFLHQEGLEGFTLTLFGLAIIGYIYPKLLLCINRKQVSLCYMLPAFFLAIVCGNLDEELTKDNGFKRVIITADNVDSIFLVANTQQYKGQSDNAFKNYSLVYKFYEDKSIKNQQYLQSKLLCLEYCMNLGKLSNEELIEKFSELVRETDSSPNDVFLYPVNMGAHYKLCELFFFEEQFDSCWYHYKKIENFYSNKVICNLNDEQFENISNRLNTIKNWLKRRKKFLGRKLLDLTPP